MIRLVMAISATDNLKTPDGVSSERRIIALVGEARLFELPDGKFELVGGSPIDRAEIEKWAHAVLGHAIDAA